MKRQTVAKLGTILILIALMVTTTGCNQLLWGTNTVSAVAGWLVGSYLNTGGTERLCYQNGVLIDCADLPADLGQ